MFRTLKTLIPGETANDLGTVNLERPQGRWLTVFTGRAFLGQREQIGFLDPELIKERNILFSSRNKFLNLQLLGEVASSLS